MRKNLKRKVILIIGVVLFSVWQAWPPGEKINLGLDLRGGMHLVLEVDTSELSPEAARDAPDRALEIIRHRTDEFGVAEPSILRQGKNRILVQLPGIEEPDRAIAIIERAAFLEFKLVNDDPEALEEALAGSIPEGYELKYLEGEPLLLEKEAALTGEVLTDAFVGFGEFGEPDVGIRFNRRGARKFARVTGGNIGERLAIVLDGKVHSAPVIQDRITGGEAVITGRFSMEEASDLALVLRAGALPAPVKIIENRHIGASLGEDCVRRGVRAAIIGLILVVLFMAAYYLLSGLIANFALCLNLVIIMGVLAGLGATLTLPGIAGIILTIGMAVDANVLIFERIREELRVGGTARSAIANGYKKAFLTILDANVTTLIAALVLFHFGTGPIRGFAVTLSIGIAASMFTALLVTRVIFDLWTMNRRVERLSI